MVVFLKYVVMLVCVSLVILLTEDIPPGYVSHRRISKRFDAVSMGSRKVFKVCSQVLRSRSVGLILFSSREYSLTLYELCLYPFLALKFPLLWDCTYLRWVIFFNNISKLTTKKEEEVRTHV